MAKKIKVNIKAAAEVPSGDVNISYKGSRIAGLSESSTAVLETENTIVQDDIEVEYTKTPGLQVLPYSLVNNSSYALNLSVIGAILYTDDNHLIVARDDEIETRGEYAAPIALGLGRYRVGIEILSATDIFNVTLNGETIPFDFDQYSVLLNFNTFEGAEMNIVINNKEN